MGDHFLKTFIKRNESFDKYFVFHVGDRGFFAEITCVARAAIYAYCHNLQLVLYNNDFGFNYQKGWADYYLPFCKEYEPSMESKVEVYAEATRKSKFMRELHAHRIDSLTIGSVTIQGFREIMSFFMLMLCRPIQKLANEAKKAIDQFGLDGDFAAVHVRRGDKVGDEDEYYPIEIYIDSLKKMNGFGLPLFVLSDDYQAIIEMKEAIGKIYPQIPIHSLCQPKNSGFDVWALRKGEYTHKHKESDKTHPSTNVIKQDTYENASTLVVETLIAAKSKIFVGTARSNVSYSIRALHEQPKQCFMLSKTHLKNYHYEKEEIQKIVPKKALETLRAPSKVLNPDAKVFCIGLSRTGTLIIHKALSELGYNSIHYPRNYNFENGRIKISQKVLEKFNAFSDTPFALAFEELDQQYPGSKFIYSTRDLNGWLKSCSQLFTAGHFKDGPVVDLCNQLYGTTIFNENVFKEAYEKHHHRILNYFSNRKKDLLIFNVFEDGNWEKLCSFLGKDIPNKPFPVLVKT